MAKRASPTGVAMVMAGASTTWVSTPTNGTSVLDERGVTVATRSFKVCADGHRAMEAWVLGLGPVRRWGVEGASGLGRHTSMYLIGRGHDVRDVCPTRTAEQSRKRRQAKSDALDSVRIAREVQADPDMPLAFKRATGDSGPVETTELIALWHEARRSLRILCDPGPR